eukprot:4960680-Pleurochrysis_carterae.AAC.11
MFRIQLGAVRFDSIEPVAKKGICNATNRIVSVQLVITHIQRRGKRDITQPIVSHPLNLKVWQRTEHLHGYGDRLPREFAQIEARIMRTCNVKKFQCRVSLQNVHKRDDPFWLDLVACVIAPSKCAFYSLLQIIPRKQISLQNALKRDHQEHLVAESEENVYRISPNMYRSAYRVLRKIVVIGTRRAKHHCRNARATWQTFD